MQFSVAGVCGILFHKETFSRAIFVMFIKKSSFSSLRALSNGWRAKKKEKRAGENSSIPLEMFNFQFQTIKTSSVDSHLPL